MRTKIGMMLARVTVFTLVIIFGSVDHGEDIWRRYFLSEINAFYNQSSKTVAAGKGKTNWGVLD